MTTNDITTKLLTEKLDSQIFDKDASAALEYLLEAMQDYPSSYPLTLHEYLGLLRASIANDNPTSEEVQALAHSAELAIWTRSSYEIFGRAIELAHAASVSDYIAKLLATLSRHS